jgi:hypothetical protein
VIEPLSLLMKLLIGCISSTTLHVDMARIKGVMNHLCESLCHKVDWFPSDFSLANQIALRPTITGLYDVLSFNVVFYWSVVCLVLLYEDG